MNREDVIGRRVEEVFEIYAESDVYSYHLVKLDLGGFLFDDQAKLTPWENSFVGFSPTIATSAFAAPPKPNPLRESYIGPKIAGILVATVVQTPIETLRKDRIYIVFDNGYYLSSGVHLGSTALECDRFDLWYPENKYFEMLRDFWSGTPVNPFGLAARRDVWRGGITVCEASLETDTPIT